METEAEPENEAANANRVGDANGPSQEQITAIKAAIANAKVIEVGQQLGLNYCHCWC